MASGKIPFKIAICHSISFVFFNTQAFSTYFKKYIDPDMQRMGYWALKECSTDHLLTTNQAESFNAVLKRFTKNEKLAVDLMVLKLYEISKHFERRTARGLASIGDYTLLEHLRPQYACQEIQLPNSETSTDIINRIRSSSSIELEVCLGIFI